MSNFTMKTLVASLAALTCLCASHGAMQQYRNPDAALSGNARKALVVPLTRISSVYRDNTKAVPRSEFSDSFMIEAVNAFVVYGLSPSFEIVPSADSSLARADSTRPRCSRLYADTQNLAATALFVRQAAGRSGADLVVIPYACSVKYTVFQPGGWRGKYEESYARPATYTAESMVCLQVWSKDGTLVIERRGTADTDRPLFYSVFKQEKPKDDVVVFAKNIFAPPIMRSMYRAVEAAVRGL